MINLFGKTASNFNNNGEATLTPTECFFSCAINGAWQLEMTLPIDPEEKYKLIDYDKILKVTELDAVMEQTSDYQLFRIYDYRKSHEAVSVLAFPVGLDARYDTYASVTVKGKTAAQAISQINGVSQKYNVTTDIDDTETKQSVAWANTNIINMLNGEESFTNTWGGEIAYDNYNIKVNMALGRASGTNVPEIRYGKNILGMDVEYDISSVITRLYLYANSGEAYRSPGYVDATNASDYPIPHIGYLNTPFNLLQTEDDGSEAHAITSDFYNIVKTLTTSWLHSFLTTTWLKAHELSWLVENYAYTMEKDGTEGICEFMWRKVINDASYPLKSDSVKKFIFNAMKEAFDDLLKNDESGTYIGSPTRQLKASGNKYVYTYAWDTNNEYIYKPYSNTYVWIYANSKWNQLDSSGLTTGATDSATWKWYKVSGKKWKRYGNKKKKRYLHEQEWEVNKVWYQFGSDGQGVSGATLMNTRKTEFEYATDSYGHTLVQDLAPECKEFEDRLFTELYQNMGAYAMDMFSTEGLSHPRPQISIDIVDLAQTTEYADYQDMLTFKLGDTVKCHNTKLGIETNLRVTGIVYDCVRKCNSQLTIGMTDNALVNMFMKIGEVKGIEEYRAGEGIVISGNTISALPQEGKISDIIVGGQSVVYGGKATIDLDEINGEGLQWFEETEDALYGAVDQIKLVDDPEYKVGNGRDVRLRLYRNNEDIGVEYRVTVDSCDASVMYYPQEYKTRSNYATHSPYLLNRGFILILSKTDNISIHVAYSPDGDPEFSHYYYTDLNLSNYPNSYSDGINSYIIYPDGHHSDNIYSPIVRLTKEKVIIDGEVWYGALINDTTGAQPTLVLEESFPTLETYLPINEYPTPSQGNSYAYETMADLLEATIPLARDISEHNYNGLSREGLLAFFAGADDEHGTDAPIKIYRDGTYEGFDMVGATSTANGKKGVVPAPTKSERAKFLRGDATWQTAVNNVKSDNVSVVDSDGVAHINTMTGATASANGSKGLVPAPTSANKDKFLKGDGTWSTPESATYDVFDDDTDGLVPAPDGDTGYLKSDGTWGNPPGAEYDDYDGTTHGLVPAPNSGDTGYLKIDGTWDEPGGTTVIANPTETATADLTKLQVGEDVYDIPSGGTTVVANPSGTPTANLEKIQVENTVYAIPSGGGSAEVITDLLDYQDSYRDWYFCYTSGFHLYVDSTNRKLMFVFITSEYNDNTDRGIFEYKLTIPSSAKKIRYTLLQKDAYARASYLSLDMYKFCIGVKSYYDISGVPATPDDNDWLVKQTEDYVAPNTTIEGELNLESVNIDSYLYITSNGYACEVIGLEMVEGGMMNLEDLTNVEITSPSNNNVLKYDSASQKWVNGIGGGGNTNALAYRMLTPSQYEALPSSEKNNGMMYFITDNSTGASGVTYIPISQIDYDNLSNAEKNNGIPYFITEVQ